MSNIDEQRARLYDLIYSGKDYGGECSRLRRVLHENGVAEGGALLEAACGTGNYLKHLRRWFDVEGFDISEQMLDRARQKLPEVELFQADMFDFEPERKYDAVVCPFSSISYAESTVQLEKAAANFRRALRPGGILVVEPWLGPGETPVGRPSMKTYEDDELKVCRQFVSQQEGRRATLDFHWLVAEWDKGVDYFISRLVAYLYTEEEYRTALTNAGFDVEYDPEGLSGRGLYIAER